MGKSGKCSSLKKRIHSVFEMSSLWSERSICSSKIMYFLKNTLFLFALHHEIYKVKGQSGKGKEPLSEQLGVTQWGGPTPPLVGSRPGLTHLPFSTNCFTVSSNSFQEVPAFLNLKQPFKTGRGSLTYQFLFFCSLGNKRKKRLSKNMDSSKGSWI